MKNDAQKNEKLIQFRGECSIAAAAAPKEGEAAKLPTMKMNVYNGGKIRVGYWGDVVVDLAGMKASDVTPILFGHDTYEVDSIVGQTSKIVVDKGITAEGQVMGVSETVQKIVALAKNGYMFQTSMGADPVRTRQVAEDEDVEVNGQTIRGPFILVTESVLNEVSILPLGADKETSAAIAANHENNEETTMKKYDKDGKEVPPTAEDIRAEAVAEQTRIAAIQTIAKDHAPIAAQAVKEGWSEDRTTLAVKDAIIAAQKAEIDTHKVQAERPAAPGITTGAQKPITARAVEAAVAIRAGLSDKGYDQATLDAASGLRIHSITDMVRAMLAIEGKPLNASRHETREFLQAAFSSRSLANVLSAVANKFILSGYGTVEQTWRKIARVRPVVDFKAHTGVRMIMANLLQALGPGGEIKHGSISDETRSVQADTKALMLGITRKDIVNDDLGALTELPQRLGYAAARTFNTDFWAVFAAAVAANFEAGGTKKNQTTGVLSLTSLAAAELLFLNQTDADGNPIGGEVTTLLCSPTVSAKAREIFASTNLVGGTSKDTAVNIYAGRFEPAVSRYLAAAPWYLVANPMGMPLMEAAFLNGREEPFVETADADFNTLGIQMRCWYDYGSAFAEYRAAVRSTGA